MKTIWKFQLPIEDETSVLMPNGARILSVQMQHGIACIWVLVNPERSNVRRHFAWRGTGHPATGLEEVAFVGTVQASSGSLVFHLFDRGE